MADENSVPTDAVDENTTPTIAAVEPVVAEEAQQEVASAAAPAEAVDLNATTETTTETSALGVTQEEPGIVYAPRDAVVVETNAQQQHEVNDNQYEDNDNHNNNNTNNDGQYNEYAGDDTKNNAGYEVDDGYGNNADGYNNNENIISSSVKIGDASTEDVLLSIPAFANAENRALNEKLIARNQLLAVAQADTLEHQERVRVMQDHLKTIRLELVENEKLLESRGKELKTEDHLSQLAERAVGRMKADISALDRDGSGISEQVASVQASIYKSSEKLEKFKSELNWKQEELEKWAVQARANEANVLALAEYTRADEQRVRDLMRELENLTGKVATKKRELDAEVTETNAKQVELDKCAEDFRNLHTERQDLIQQWQESLEAIKNRDEAIGRAGAKFGEVKTLANTRRNLLNEREKRLTGLNNENTGMERTIEDVHRRVGDARDQLTSWTSKVNRLRESVDILKSEVSSAASDLVRRRQENENYRITVEEKELKLDRLRKELDDTRQRLLDTREMAMSVEEALVKKEEFLKQERIAVDKTERELSALKEAEYRARETVAALHHEEELLMGQIAGAKREIRSLSDKVAELDALSVKQQEHVYAAEFQIQQMERKIGRAKGEVSHEERVKLEARIEELRKDAEEARFTEKSLSEEVKKVKNSLITATRHAADLGKQLTEMNGRIDELLLQARSGEDGLKKAVRDKEESMVSHDLLKLEVRRLRDALSSKTDEVFTLENRAVQLEMTIEGRKKEIEAHRAVQRTAAKLAEEERHRLALDVADRTTRINTLKAKYETLCARLRGGTNADGSSGEEKSQAYFVLKAAQQREELQREGDELDQLIKKAERETKALAHTLQYLNSRNDTLRTAFHQVDEGSDDVSVVRALEAQANDAQDNIFKRKKIFNKINNEVEEGSRRLEAMGDRIAGLVAQISVLENEAVRVNGERSAQLRTVEEVLNRLDGARQRHRRARAARTGAGANAPTPDEIAFIALGLKDTNSSVLYTLGQLAVEYPQMKPSLNALLAERGLRMPARPPSRLPMAGGGGAGGSSNSNNHHHGGNGVSAFTAGVSSSSSSSSSGTGIRGNGSNAIAAIPVSPMVVPNAATGPRAGGGNISSRAGAAAGGRRNSAGSEGGGGGNRVPTPGKKGVGATQSSSSSSSRGGGVGTAAAAIGGGGMSGLGIMGRPVSQSQGTRSLAL